MNTNTINTLIGSPTSKAKVSIINDGTTSGLSCAFGTATDIDPGAGIDYEYKSLSCTGLQISNLSASSTIDNMYVTNPVFEMATLLLVFIVIVALTVKLILKFK